MRALFLLTGFILFCTHLQAQDTLNMVTAKNKKHGYWIQYLDAQVNPTIKEKAVYSVLAFYDNGQVIFEIAFRKWAKNARVEYTSATSANSLTSGTFKWYDTQNRIIGEEEYKDGYPQKLISFKYAKTGDQFIHKITKDYTKKYKDCPMSYYYEERGADNKLLVYGYYYKDKNTWVLKKSK